MYKCLQCSKEIAAMAYGTVRCPSCGFKIFSKTREPIAKTIKAI